MRQLASRLDLISPSPTLALDSKAKAMKAAGQDVINFGIGEPDFDTPDHIKEAAIKAIKDGFTRYTAADGIMELKEAVCHKFQRDNGLTFTPSQIVISNGGKHSLFNTFQALFQPGDEVILPIPTWVSNEPITALSGAKAVFVKTFPDNDYCLSPEALEAAITPNTKGLLINSPSNPTGQAYSKEKLKALIPLIIKHNLWVVSDDIYEKIIYDNFKFNNLLMLAPELKDQAVIAHGLSKTYAMTGWRIGYLAAPEKVARQIAKFQSHSTSNPCSISQKAGVAALNGPQDEVNEMVKNFQRRRDLIMSLLAKIPNVITPRPQGAFYVFPDFSAYFGRQRGELFINNPNDLADYLLSEAGAAIVPGTSFEDDRTLRLSYAVSDEDIERGLTRVAQALEKLK